MDFFRNPETAFAKCRDVLFSRVFTSGPSLNSPVHEAKHDQTYRTLTFLKQCLCVAQSSRRIPQPQNMNSNRIETKGSIPVGTCTFLSYAALHPRFAVGFDSRRSANAKRLAKRRASDGETHKRLEFLKLGLCFFASNSLRRRMFGF